MDPYDALGDLAKQTWMDEALCAQSDPDAWFPGKGEPAAEARRICDRCPVRIPCLEFALDNGERHGVWGGTSDRERRQLRNKSRKVVEVLARDADPAPGECAA